MGPHQRVESSGLDCIPAGTFGIKVCLLAYSKPTIDNDPRRLPLYAVKVSTGKVIEKGDIYYLKAPWKEGWSNWLKLAKEGFPSVLEHITFTFFIDGLSRVASHQLVRHRLVSFTQESQRYTEARILQALGVKDVKEAVEVYETIGEEEAKDIAKGLFIIPSDLQTPMWFWLAIGEYLNCRASGGTMEDCRYLLPQAIRTSLMATANLREWLHIIELRTSPKAQEEIRTITKAIKQHIKRIVPEVFS